MLPFPFYIYLLVCSGFFKCVSTFTDVLEVGCVSKQPDCKVPPAGNDQISATYAFEEIKKSLVSVTGHDQVSYFGQDAIYSVLIDLNQTEVKDVSPIVYIDGCKVELSQNNICVKIKNGTEIELRCTIHNISESDVSTRIIFFGISASLKTQLCYHKNSLTLNPLGKLFTVMPVCATKIKL